MLRPPLAFMEKQLTMREKMKHSAHGARKVKFEDQDGQYKTGYFKACDPNGYPTILAKYVVAFSVFVRAALGERAAEERLVYNDRDEIIGTVAIQVPDFVPFLKPGETYTDPLQQKWGNPDKQTLIEKDVASLLVSAYKHIQDDLHPDNFSVNGLIDFDELYIELTSIIKGARASRKITYSPQVVSDLKEEDLKIFPNITVRTHWPTNRVPKNFNLLKNYQTAAFLELQGDPEFHQQYFTALLKELLAYDEDMLENRLRLYLGNEDIDLQSLPLDKRKELLKFWHRGNDNLYDELKDKPNAFVRHCMRFYKLEHKKFEDMVLRFPEFQEFVLSFNKKPMEYSRLENWFRENNKINLVHYNLRRINEKYQYILRECIKTSLEKQLQSLQNTIISSTISGSKEVITIDQKKCNHEIIEIISSSLLKIEQKSSAFKINYQTNIISKQHETKQLTQTIFNHLQNHAKELYEQMNARKEIYYKKSTLTIEDNHAFINDMEAILKNAEVKRADYKKWLLETKEKLNQVVDFAIYIDPLIVEMNFLFADLDLFSRSFKSEILTPLKSPGIIPYLPQPISVFTPKTPEIKITQTPLTSPTTSVSTSTPILRREQPEDEPEIPENIPDEISRLLAIWITSVDPTQIKDAIAEARKQYDKKYLGVFSLAYSFLTPPRNPEEDKKPLNEIFSKGGWNANSLNTNILKNLCLQMLEEYNKSYLINNTDNAWWEKYSKEIAKKSGIKKDSKSPLLEMEIESEVKFKTLPA